MRKKDKELEERKEAWIKEKVTSVELSEEEIKELKKLGFI